MDCHFTSCERPASILTLGLFDTAGVEPPIYSELQELLEQGDNPIVVRIKEDVERLLTFVFHEPPFMPRPIKPELAEPYIARATIDQKIWDDLSSRLEHSLDALHTLSMPVLVLWGNLDRVLDVSSVEVYKEHLPDPTIVIMTDRCHSPMAERPAEAASIYARFLGDDPDTPLPRGTRRRRE